MENKNQLNATHILFGKEEPENPVNGDLWFNMEENIFDVKQYEEGKWTVVNMHIENQEQDKDDYEEGVKVLNENNKTVSRDEVIASMFMPLDDKEND